MNRDSSSLLGNLLLFLGLLYYGINGVFLPLFTNFNDFEFTYQAGKRLAAGEDVYQDYARYRHLTAETYRGNFKFYLYPPLVAVWARSISEIPYEAARWLWHLFNQVMVLLGFVLLTKTLNLWEKPLERGVAGLLYFHWYPLVDNAQFGNYDTFIFALIIGGYLAWQRGQDVLTGFLWGLATALKTFPGFIVAWFLWKREWKVVLWTGAAFLALNSLTLPWFPPEAHLRWFKMASDLPIIHASPVNQSVTAFWTRLLTEDEIFTAGPFNLPAASHAVILLSRLALIAGLLWVTWRKGTRSSLREHLGFGLALITMMLIPHFSDVHHLVPTVVPLIALAMACWHEILPRKLLWPLAASYGIIAFWIPIFYFRVLVNERYLWLTQGWAVLLLSPHFYASCLAYGMVAWALKTKLSEPAA